MKLLLVYQSGQFTIDGPFQHWQAAARTIAPIPEKPGAQTLERGVYRFADHVTVTPVGDGKYEVVPMEKSPWPDPPVVKKLASLGVNPKDPIAEGTPDLTLLEDDRVAETGA